MRPVLFLFLMEDIWQKIPGYEHYEISICGKVRSAATGKILKYDKAGRPNYRYNSVRLYFKGGRVHLVVHKLVYLTFHGEIPEGAQVDHIDRNRFNNHAENLRAVSPEENKLNMARYANNPECYDENAIVANPLDDNPYNL